MQTRHKLTDLIKPDVLLELQESFAHATGMGTVFTDEKGTHMNKGSNFSSFCKHIHDTPWGLNCCKVSNSYATQIAMRTNQPFIYICHAGLVDIEIPIIVNEELIGSIMAGQVRCQDPPYNGLKQMPSSRNWRTDHSCKDLYEETGLLPWKKIEAAANALFVFANYIAEKGMAEILQTQITKKQTELLNELSYRTKLEKLLKMAEFNALQEQTNPHFFFNILNSISRLIHLGYLEEAQKTIDVFASMMRYSLQGTKQFVTLRKELEYIEKYLFIQNMRFGNRVQYEIQVVPELYDLEIPFFSLQPFVENAIKHGLEPLDAQGTIRIIGRITSKLYVIAIEDNGVGMDPDIMGAIRASMGHDSTDISADHFGFLNAYERLRIHFGNDFSINIESCAGQGTQIQIILKRR